MVDQIPAVRTRRFCPTIRRSRLEMLNLTYRNSVAIPCQSTFDHDKPVALLQLPAAEDSAWRWGSPWQPPDSRQEETPVSGRARRGSRGIGTLLRANPQDADGRSLFAGGHRGGRLPHREKSGSYLMPLLSTTKIRCLTSLRLCLDDSRV